VNQDIESAQLLASKGADVHCVTPSGEPIIMVSCFDAMPVVI